MRRPGIPDGSPDPLAEFRERLDEIKDTERTGLAADESEDARFAELELETLPTTCRQIRQLREYEWRSPEAGEAFEELLDEFRRQMLDASFRQADRGMQGADPRGPGPAQGHDGRPQRA
jgi:uncharacterized protein with von Willebrand factor type A (vWA) domain